MGYRFQSEFLYDRKLNRELLRGTEDASRPILVMNLIQAGLLVWLFGFALSMGAADYFSQVMIFLWLFLVLVSFVKALTRIGGGIHYRQALSLNNGEVPNCCVQFWDSYVLDITKGGTAQRQLDYDQFRGIIETKNLFLLKMKHNLYLMVDKRTLSGDGDAFLEFLFFKCDNIRRKRVRSVIPGKLVRGLKYLVISGLLLAAVVLHPRLDLEHRMAGQIHNGMTGPEIVERLEALGITGLDVEEAAFDAEYWAMDWLAEDSKLTDILYYPTLGSWDAEQEILVPGPINYGFCHYWADEEAVMYTQLLRKLDAMCDDISIGAVKEEHLTDSQYSYTGTALISFEINDTAYAIHARLDYDLYDPEVFRELSRILEEETGKKLWFRDYQEFGTWLFLGTGQWAQSFEAATGWTLSDDYSQVCPEYYLFD